MEILLVLVIWIIVIVLPCCRPNVTVRVVLKAIIGFCGCNRVVYGGLLVILRRYLFFFTDGEMSVVDGCSSLCMACWL